MKNNNSTSRSSSTDPHRHSPALTGIVAFAALLLVGSSSLNAESRGHRDRDRDGKTIDRIVDLSQGHIAKAMRRAASRDGLRIETAGMSVVSKDGATMAAATILGLEQRPATDLVDGIDTGYIYMDGATHLDPGFYLVRVTTRTAELGDNVGVIELLDRSSTVVWREPTIINIRSLTLPERPDGFVARTSVGIDDTNPFNPFGPCSFQVCFL